MKKYSLFFPYKRYTIRVPYAADEIVARLKPHIDPLRHKGSRRYQGHITDRSFYLDRQAYTRGIPVPIIKGRIKEDAEGSRINVTMRLGYWSYYILLVVTLSFAIVGLDGVVRMAKDVAGVCLGISGILVAVVVYIVLTGWFLSLAKADSEFLDSVFARSQDTHIGG